MNSGARRAFTTSVSVFAMLAAGSALAQENAQAAEAVDDRGGIDEIVVTAQRRAQSLQDVPIAVSAFSNEALADQQIENTLDLQQALPNTTFTKSNFTGSSITIRGIGSPAVATSGDSGIGVHYNDMPLVASRLFENEFFDLERLEVLRGPQGTLFGRNATGGVINLITATPKKEFQAAGEFEYGNFNSIVGRGMVNAPLADFAAVRLAGIYVNRDGYTENVATGNDIDGRDSFALRGSLLIEPTIDTTFTVTAEYFEEDSDRSRIQKQLCATDPTGILGCRPDRLGFGSINSNATLATILSSSQFLSIAASPALAPFALYDVYGPSAFSNANNPTDPRKVAIDFEPTYKADQLIIQAELEHDFGGVVATLNGGYSKTSVRSRTDYNLSITDSVQPQIARLTAIAGGAFGPDAAAIAGGILATPLFQNGQICVSDATREQVGIANGVVNRCADNTSEFDESGIRNEQWSVEARLASDFDGPFNFLIGGLYLQGEATESDYFVNASGLDYASVLLGGPASNFAAIVGPPMFNNLTDLVELDTYGIFGEVYFEVNDQLKITGGLRYSNDKKFVRDRTFLLNFPIPFGTEDARVLAADGRYDADPSVAGAQAFREQTFDDDAITGRLVIDYTPDVAFSDDTLIYASYTRGYKPGGINPAFDPTVLSAPVSFASEKINAYEIGMKNSFGGGTAQVNLTGFYYDYKGLQVSRILNRTSFNDNTDAQVYGLELESILAPTEGLTINASLSYQKTKIKDLAIFDSRDPSAGRSDAVLIKDITNASNCVLASATPGAVSQEALVGIVNAFNQNFDFDGPGPNPSVLRSAVPVPGTNTFGAFSLCGALAGAIASGAFDAFGGQGILLEFQPNGTPILPGGIPVDLSGNELANSPNWKFSVGAQYEILTDGGWTITPRVDVNFTGNSFSSNFNQATDRLEGYEIVNAQLTLRSPDERFYVRGFIQNAFDTLGVTGRYRTDQSSGLFTNEFYTEPRRYGAAVGFKF
ncbi:TonB-dependent receptor [Pacificimonas sp. WHA3]|uniref:TonB-dependent receptor n=2 Tax=Pacificimonas pallii TaxID=2827236 RepID=A0ABS6SFQ1_9SPHN|nr:TonB-dependent receptor [Pacificimonas pallii]